MIYSKKIKQDIEWLHAFTHYEAICGFEPMYQDHVDSGELTMRQAWDMNIRWLEDVVASVTNLPTPINIGDL